MSMSVSIIDLYSASPRKPLMRFISFISSRTWRGVVEEKADCSDVHYHTQSGFEYIWQFDFRSNDLVSNIAMRFAI